MEWVNYIAPYALMLVKAIVVFVVGWIVAEISRSLTVNLLNRFKSLKEQKELCESTGNLVYYFILLATIVAVLEVFGLKYVAQPFVDLLNKVAVYVPNIVGAGVVFLVGFLFAKVAREFTKSLLETLQIEKFSEKYKIGDLKDIIANVVYLTILLFVIVASLNALQLEVITKPAISMINSILIAIPKIIAASIVFVSIYYIGKIVTDIVVKLIDELNIESFIQELGLSTGKFKFEELVRYLVLSFVILLGLAQAFNYLEAEALYEITYKFIYIAFKLVVASVIILIGAYFGNLFEKRLENKNIGKFVKIAFILAAVFISLPYVGISPEIIEIVVLSISLGVGLAFALAFGLGGKEVASEILRNFLNQKSNKN